MTYLQDPKLLAALVESRKRQAPYAGAFLVKDEPDADPSVDSGKSALELKGKELLNRLHEVGTLVQVMLYLISLSFSSLGVKMNYPCTISTTNSLHVEELFFACFTTLSEVILYLKIFQLFLEISNISPCWCVYTYSWYW